MRRVKTERRKSGKLEGMAGVRVATWIDDLKYTGGC